MTDAIQVITTTAAKSDAEKIARTLVERRLAACVQIGGPIMSCYRWQGEIETADEWVCTIKTHRERYAQVEAAIKEVHPYETPEILVTSVVGGSQEYLAWLAEETSLSAQGPCQDS